MNIFEIIILDSIYILFPILSFILYMFFRKTKSLEKNNLFLDCALFSSLYFLIKYGINNYYGIPIIFFDILLIIAYISNRKLGIVLLSIIYVVYYHYIFNISIIILVIEYILYFTVYLLIKSRNKFINIYFVLKSLFYLFNYFNIINIIDYLIMMIIFYLLTKLIINLYSDAVSMCSIYKSIEEIEKEKNIKNSLFKITHEIKNPIAVVKGYLDMIDLSDCNKSKKYIKIMKDEVNRILILLQDFLSINKIKIEKEEMDLSLLLEDLVNNFKVILKNKNIILNYDEIDELYISADYNRLKQVLVNILKNSYESIIDNGEIKISVKKNKTNIKIVILDNGKGMTKEELKKIKEAFFTTKENGTGLGIYLSNEIIKKHGGKLTYESNNLGTKVIVSLPY